MSLNLPDTLTGAKEKLAARLPRADRPKVPGKKGSKERFRICWPRQPAGK